MSGFKLLIERIPHPIAEASSISLSMVRADKVSQLASGNKIYKLLPNLQHFEKIPYTKLLSFGGAFSNHIHALALYANAIGVSSIGVIRGEAEYASNPTLSAAQKAGMQLLFVDRQTYRRRYDKDYLAALQQQFPDAYIIPEGGNNELAQQGCMQLMQDVNAQHQQQLGYIPDVVTTACGTGTTYTGMVKAAEIKQIIKGYLVVRDSSVNINVETSLRDVKHHPQCDIQAADYGGYAKFDADLLAFILDFLKKTDVLLDPIYTSKMVRKVMHQIEFGELPDNTRIAMIHTGGLQAWYGMKEKAIRLGGEESWKLINEHL